jgi:hypothetical protein
MRKWGEPNACAFSSALPPCRQLPYPPPPRCRTCSARRLAAGLSHPASGRAGMRRVGGRRRSSVSDRANTSVVAAGEVTDEQAAIPDKCPGGLAAGSCDRPRALRPPNCCHASSCATRTRLHRSDRANMYRAAALRQTGGRSPYFCNGFWPAPGPLYPTRPLRLTSPTNAPASVTRTRLHLSDRANVHRAAAPIGASVGRGAAAQLL